MKFSVRRTNIFAYPDFNAECLFSSLKLTLTTLGSLKLEIRPRSRSSASSEAVVIGSVVKSKNSGLRICLFEYEKLTLIRRKEEDGDIRNVANVIRVVPVTLEVVILFFYLDYTSYNTIHTFARTHIFLKCFLHL